MAVVIDSGNALDNCVGLAAISRHQGWWSHNPNVQLVAPADNAFRDWLRDNLGSGVSRLARRPLTEQITGHTAVFSRVHGRVTFVRGFVPNFWGYLWAFFGAGGGGHWQDDAAMLADPTCVSFEIPVGEVASEIFADWFRNHAADVAVYSLSRGDAKGTFNCVLGAVTLLVNFLDDIQGPPAYIQQLLTVNSSLQGHLIRRINGGLQ